MYGVFKYVNYTLKLFFLAPQPAIEITISMTPKRLSTMKVERKGPRPLDAHFAKMEASGMVGPRLRALAKSSTFLHRSYKMLRDARNIPPEKLLRPAQMHAVYKVLPNTMLPMPRLFDAYEAVVSINSDGLPGDIVECGVWNGGCVGLMAIANLENPGPRRRFHLFDSFEGLPQPSSHDKEVIVDFEARHPGIQLHGDDQELTPIGACAGISQPAVAKFLVEKLRLPRDIFVFHVGWFQDTVPRSLNVIEKIALLRIDGDWYDSTKVCLETLYDRVVQNGFIIIDDYGTFSGCRKAVDEFFLNTGTSPRIQKSDQDCIYFRKP
jgi:O-methyltransferase